MRITATALGFAALAFGIFPVSAPAADQKLTQTYRFECSSVPPLRIQSASIWLGKTDAIVSGELSRIQAYSVDPDDYVEVRVISPEGKVLSTQQTDYSPKPVPHFTSRHGNQYSVYAVKVHFVPPPYSTIKVTYVRRN